MGLAKITVEQAATIERVWLEKANASEAGRQAGCSEATARRYILKARLPKADELYAQATAEAERLHLALVEKARRKVSAALDMAGTDSGAVAELARAANDSLRAVTSTRVAHLKAAGLSAPDRTDVTSGGEKIATVVMLPRLDDERPSAAEDPLAAEPGAAD